MSAYTTLAGGKRNIYFITNRSVIMRKRSVLVVVGMLVMVLVFGAVLTGCVTLGANTLEWPLSESYRYVTPELFATLGEEQLRKTEFVLSADIELTRSLSANTQGAVKSGQATINQAEHDEVITITVNTPGELVDVSTVKLEYGSEVQVLGVCFDEDSSKVLYFIYGTLPKSKVTRANQVSQTGYFLLAENINFNSLGFINNSIYDSYLRGTGRILYGDTYYTVTASVRSNSQYLRSKSQRDYDAWPFLRAKVVINETKKVTAKKATGRVVQ
jgi:hypothetical protein